MTITFGGLVMTGLIIALVVIGVKVKNNTDKLNKLDEMMDDE